MDLVSRFRARKFISPILDVKLDDFTFKVARFSQAEMNAAQRYADVLLREAGHEPEKAPQMERAAMLCIAATRYIARHCKSFEHPQIEFSPEAMKIVLEELTQDEQIQLGAAYMKAADTDQKKALSEASQTPDLSSSASAA